MLRRSMRKLRTGQAAKALASPSHLAWALAKPKARARRARYFIVMSIKCMILVDEG
jgi:hypothetical protein